MTTRKPFQAPQVLQRRQLAAYALAVAAIERKEARERELSVRSRGHSDVGDEGADQIVGLTQADHQLAADPAIRTGRQLADRQALDLTLIDGLRIQSFVLERLDQGRSQPPGDDRALVDGHGAASRRLNQAAF